MWQETYPSIAAVNEAALSTLDQWDKQLPDPQTDVECAVRRRIKKQMNVLALQDLKAIAPEVHASYTGFLHKIDQVLKGHAL